MAPVFSLTETSVNLNVLIFGLTLIELICGLLSALLQFLGSTVLAALTWGREPRVPHS